MVTDVGTYLRSAGADQRGGAHAPSGVPETVYHDDAGKRAKLGVKLPVAPFGVALASVVVADRFGLEGTTAENVVTGVAGVWLPSMGVGAVLFVVSASRDKRMLHEATGRATPGHPIVAGILVYVTGGAYALFYPVARSGKYAVDDRASDPPTTRRLRWLVPANREWIPVLGCDDRFGLESPPCPAQNRTTRRTEGPPASYRLLACYVPTTLPAH